MEEDIQKTTNMAEGMKRNIETMVNTGTPVMEEDSTGMNICAVIITDV